MVLLKQFLLNLLKLTVLIPCFCFIFSSTGLSTYVGKPIILGTEGDLSSVDLTGIKISPNDSTGIGAGYHGGGAEHSDNTVSYSDSSPEALESTLGLFTYFNQGDPRWADSLYGVDPMHTHGCGPTALSMIVSSFTNTPITPPEMAVWANDNGYCIPGQGSLHSLIPEGCAAFGLTAVPMQEHTKEAMINEIQSGKIIVALMKRGFFTNKGHFIILIKVTEDGKVRIADPANVENSQQDFDFEFILSQLRTNASSGGPLWSVGLPSY